MRQQKIESAREENKDKDLEGCTFEPKLYQYKPPKHQKGTSGINKSNMTNNSNNLSGIMYNKSNMDNLSFNRSKQRSSSASRSYSQIHEKK